MDMSNRVIRRLTKRSRERRLIESAEYIVDVELRLLLIARQCVKEFGGSGLQITRDCDGQSVTAEIVGEGRSVDLCDLDPQRWHACVSLARYGVDPGQTRLVAP